MKDLFVWTADSDAEALIRAVLQRHRDLQIHPISFDVDRLFSRDSGMVKEGPEIARARVSKTEYSRLILVWDHDGSGWEQRVVPEQAVTRIQQRLDGVTWTDRSAAVVIVPELEEWLWHCPASVARHLGVSAADLDTLTARVAAELSLSREPCCRERPKELFEGVLYYKKRRKPLPEDFRMLGSSANLAKWSASETFGRLVEVLRAWFPAR
jgi:hypothetical protein